MAFDTEMVVRFLGKFASTGPTFQYALGQGDARRNAESTHFVLGDFRKLTDVLLGIRNGKALEKARIFGEWVQLRLIELGPFQP